MPPARVPSRASIEPQAFGRLGYVRIAGVIDETFVPGKLTLATPQLIFDVGRVASITSFGVRQWIALVGALPAGTDAISIIHAPPALVDQLGMVSNFAGVAGVVSVLAPYECESCGQERLGLIDMTLLASSSAVESGVAPERTCPVCQRPLRFADNATEYFQFFKSNPPPYQQPIVEQFLRLLRMPDGLDSAGPFKLVEDNVTYYQLRGKLGPGLNVRRMTGGLEGKVVFDFAQVSSVEPGGYERLTALLEQSAAATEVTVSRVPQSVLASLSSERSVKLASVLLRGLCKVCGEVRPQVLPAHPYLEQCRRGAVADRPCPVCGNPALLQGAAVSPFLERHADLAAPLAQLQVLQTKAFCHLLDAAAAASPERPSAAPAQSVAAPRGVTVTRDLANPTLTGEPRGDQAAGRTLDSAAVQLTEVAAADPFLGSVVSNYRLTRILGQGASARVYLGEHSVLGSRVAVKILHPSLAKDSTAVARFIREARTTSTVIHDNVVQVLDITSDRNVFCIIMEYLDGQTLGDACAGRVVPYEEAAPLLLQVCNALATAHSHGIVHRDLKPDNLYLLKGAGRTQVKIVDFGIARRETLSEGEARTKVGTILGTPQYMSPEQAFSLKVDSRADIYSLGVIMFELATGRLPFQHESIRALLSAHGITPPPRPRSLNSKIDPAYEEVILKTLAKDPKDRYQTMGDLGRAIAQIREGRGATALTPPMGLAAAAAVALEASSSAMRRHPRLPVELALDVEFPLLAGASPRVRERMTFVDISLSGGFIRSQKTIPEVFTRLVLHPLIPGARPLVAEVIRTTRHEDPETRAVVTGFGVSFIPTDDALAQAQTIQAILALSGQAAAGRPAIEVETEQFLSRLEAEAEGDHYGLLGIALYADFPTVRNACAQLARVLDAAQLRGLSPEDLVRVTKGRDRLRRAEDVMADPNRRAAYDAGRSNFVGIARCLASGLDTAALGRLRSQFLLERPELPDLMPLIRTRLDEAHVAGDPHELLEALTVALRIDPLALDLQTQYWEVWRRVNGDELLKAEGPSPDSASLRSG